MRMSVLRGRFASRSAKPSAFADHDHAEFAGRSRLCRGSLFMRDSKSLREGMMFIGNFAGGPNTAPCLPRSQRGRAVEAPSAARRSASRRLLDAADHIEKRLTLFAHHDGSGALEGAGQCGGVFDALAIASGRDADLLECREAIEPHER